MWKSPNHHGHCHPEANDPGLCKKANRRMQINPFLSPYTKLNSKWVKDLHIKPDALRLIEKKMGKNLEHMGTEGNFLNRRPIAYALRSRIDK